MSEHADAADGREERRLVLDEAPRVAGAAAKAAGSVVPSDGSTRTIRRRPRRGRASARGWGTAPSAGRSRGGSRDDAGDRLRVVAASGSARPRGLSAALRARTDVTASTRTSRPPAAGAGVPSSSSIIPAEAGRARRGSRRSARRPPRVAAPTRRTVVRSRSARRTSATSSSTSRDGHLARPATLVAGVVAPLRAQASASTSRAAPRSASAAMSSRG